MPFQPAKDSPRIQVSNLLLRTKARIVDVAKMNRTTTSQVVADVLLAVEGHLPELFFLGRRQRAVIEQDLRLPEAATRTDEETLQKVLEEVEEEK